MEHVALDAVGEQRLELARVDALLEHVLRAALAERRVALLRAAARRPRAGAVLVEVEQRVLAVVEDEAEPAVRAGAVADPEPVVRALVAHEVGDRRVEVAAPVDDEHHVDQVDGVDEHGVGGVWGAVRVVAEQALVGGVVLLLGEAAGQGGVGEVPERVPGVERAVGGLDAAAEVGVDLDRVVVVGVAAEVGGGEVGVGALVDVEQAPVLAVEVEVVAGAVAAGVAGGELHVAGEGVADEDAAGVGLIGPRVVLGAAEVELVELGGGAGGVAEQREVEPGGAVAAAEEQAERVLRVVGGAGEAAADAQAAVGLEAR